MHYERLDSLAQLLVLWQERWRLRKSVIDKPADVKRLSERRPIKLDGRNERRAEPLLIPARLVGQIDLDQLVGEALEVERESDALRVRA